VLLVIAITVGVTLFFTRGSGGGGTNGTNGASSIASAHDTGPVAIITFEPTCQAWMPISNTMSQVQDNGWGDRDPSISAASWTAEQRAQYEAVAKSLQQTADQAVNFARQTPNRVVRELYEQFIVYAHAYADSIPTYTESDNALALANIAASLVVDSVCNSITYGSAVARSTTATTSPPSATSDPTDPAEAKPFISKPDSQCDTVIQRGKALVTELSEWSKQDASFAATDWTPEEKAAAAAAAPIMKSFADDMETIGKKSTNPTFQDLAFFAALYSRAYGNALATYKPADNFLLIAGTRANNVLISACQAAAR
jgi:hypothetical protein